MVQKVIVLVAVIAILEGSLACVKKFSNEQAITEAFQACAADFGVAMPTYPNYLDEGFDDKCVAKCVLKRLEILDDAGNLDRDGAFDMLEDKAPKQLVNKLTESMSKCAESSGVLKIDGADKCRPLAAFYGCFVTSADMLC